MKQAEPILKQFLQDAVEKETTILHPRMSVQCCIGKLVMQYAGEEVCEKLVEDLETQLLSSKSESGSSNFRLATVDLQRNSRQVGALVGRETSKACPLLEGDRWIVHARSISSQGAHQ